MADVLPVGLATNVLGLPLGVAYVFAVVVVTVAILVTESVPPDVTAIGVIVALVVAPWTGLTVADGLSGLSNPATVTVLAMYVLSRAVGETGLVRRLGVYLSTLTGGRESRILAAVVAVSGTLAGIVNNTPVVAVFVPMVTDVANDAGISPSKVLLPLSYASMLGGTLTLLGTATNLVASDLSAELIGHPFTVFEFTGLGVVVFVVGAVYLLTVGRALIPARVPPGDRTTQYAVHDYLARVYVPPDSTLVGTSVGEVAAAAVRDLDVDVLDVFRLGEHFVAADSDQHVAARDVLTVRGTPAALRQFVSLLDVQRLDRATFSDADLDERGRAALVEVVVPTSSALVDESIRDARLRERYDATVLAVRRPGGDLIRERLGDVVLTPGDSLLVQTTEETAAYLHELDDFVVTSELEPDATDGEIAAHAPLTVGIVLAVVALAALGVVPIVVAALGGVVAVVVFGVLSPNEVYDAVNWRVIFLLAGLIPLGLALRETGGAAVVADAVVGGVAGASPVLVLGVVYLLTGLLANVVTPVAAVTLLLPVAVDTATRIDADPFAFVLAVTLAASTAFLTPIGYQTNLMVYGPGGYRFTDYVRVGAPLQLLLAVVTTLGIVAMWGV